MSPFGLFCAFIVLRSGLQIKLNTVKKELNTVFSSISRPFCETINAQEMPKSDLGTDILKSTCDGALQFNARKMAEKGCH